MTSRPTLGKSPGTCLQLRKANTLGKVHLKYEAGTLNGFENINI